MQMLRAKIMNMQNSIWHHLVTSWANISYFPLKRFVKTDGNLHMHTCIHVHFYFQFIFQAKQILMRGLVVFLSLHVHIRCSGLILYTILCTIRSCAKWLEGLSVLTFRAKNISHRFHPTSFLSATAFMEGNALILTPLLLLAREWKYETGLCCWS